MNWLFVILGISVIALICLLVWLLIIVFRESKESKDATLHLNFMSHFDQSNGCFIGAETANMGGKDGRHLIELMPKDVNVDKLEKDVKPVKIIVDRNKYLSFPKGTLSKSRNISIGMPLTADHMHEAVKDSIFGKGLMFATELQNAANAEISSLLEGHTRKDEILRRIGHAEISKEFLNLMNESYHDALKLALDAKNKDVKSSTLLPSSPPRT